MENRRAGFGGVFLICPALRVYSVNRRSGMGLSCATVNDFRIYFFNNIRKKAVG